MPVLINGRTAVHKESDGTLTTVDPCYTGPQRQVVNYQNVAKSKDATNTAKTVFINGNPVCHKNSFFSQSYGDEAGDGGGVQSGTTRGKAEFVSASDNVFIEGIAAVRQGDHMVSNNRNTQPAPLQQKGVPFKGDQEKINNFPKLPYPKLEFDLAELPVIHFSQIADGIREITLALSGGLILQKNGETNPLIFDLEGYKLSAKNSLHDFFSYMTIISNNKNQVGIGSSITREFWSTHIEFQPLAEWIFSASPESITKLYNDWLIQGNLGFCMTIDSKYTLIPLISALIPAAIKIGIKIGEKFLALLSEIIIATWIAT